MSKTFLGPMHASAFVKKPQKRAAKSKGSTPKKPKPPKIFARTKIDDPEKARRRKAEEFEQFLLQKITGEQIAQRTAELERLKTNVLDLCNELPLMEAIDYEDNNIVFFRGAVNAELMIIGEAPGEVEARTGLPFVGPSGEALNTQLRANGIDPDRHVFITNLLFVRPPRNRNPNWEEVTAYLPFLRRLIQIIQPKVILCLGAFSSTVVRNGLNCYQQPYKENMDGTHPVALRSLFSLYKQKANQGVLYLNDADSGIYTYAAYHPSAILRDEKKRTSWDNDFNAVRTLLHQPRLDYINAEKLIAHTIPPDFVFNTPDDMFYQREEFTLPDGPVEFEVHKLDYNREENTFHLVGRTIEGASICATVSHPEFCFWLDLKNEQLTHSLGEYGKQLTNSLCDAMIAKNPKYKQLDREGSLSSLCIELEYTKQRSYFKVSPTTSQFVKVRFQQDDTKYELKSLIQKLWPSAEFFELSLTPEKRMFFDRSIYVHGWVQIQDWKPVPTQQRESICDFEVSAWYDDVMGFSPHGGDKKWQRFAPLKTISLDAEMLNSFGRFPIPEQDPIVMICAYTGTSSRPDNFNILEQIRTEDGRKTRMTGRSNYDSAVAFCVGSVNQLRTEEFEPRFLPNIPPPPEETDAKNLIVVRRWNEFIREFRKWTGLVGSRRVRTLLNNPELEAAITTLQTRPEDVVWSEEQISDWGAQLVRIRELWPTRLDIDIKNLKTGKRWQEKFDKCESREQQNREFGSIESSWRFFRLAKQVFCFETERDMIRGFYAYMRQYDPDIVTGYNIANFDLRYFVKRVEVLGLQDPETNLPITMGRFPRKVDIDEVKQSYSRATGDREYHTIKIAGRDVYDLMHFIMRDHKLQSYELAAVAKNFLGDTKNDVPYSAIPSLFVNDRDRLAFYCLKDAELVLMLLNYLNNLNFMLSLARLIGTIPIERLYVDGKQSQVFSCLMRQLRTEGLSKIMPDENPFTSEDSFDGAYVFEPKKLGLCKKLKLCFDFSSLYPSIMISHNLGHDMCAPADVMETLGISLSQCYRTELKFPVPGREEPEHYYFLQPRKLTLAELEENQIDVSQCRKINGSPEYWVPQFGSRKRITTQAGVEALLQEHGLPEQSIKRVCHLLQRGFGPLTEDETRELSEYWRAANLPEGGIRYFFGKPDLYLPKRDEASLIGAVQEMLAARKLINAEKDKYPPDSEEYKRLDSQQAALKIVANSTYGACGVSKGRLASKHISATVTYIGRGKITWVSETLAENFQGDTDGGDTDSVFEIIPSIDTLDKVYEVIEVEDPNTGERYSVTRIKQILDHINPQLRWPENIAFEKCFLMTFTIAKKRMAYISCMPVFDKIEKRMRFFGEGDLSFKGLETKRRDSCLIAQQTLKGFFARLFTRNCRDEEAIASAVSFAQTQVEKVVRGEVPFHQMIQARQLSKRTYNSKQPHVELCKKKRKRGEEVPALGSRIPFVVVTGRKGRSFSESVEDPDYVLQHNLQVDYMYIVEKKIEAPIARCTNLLPNGAALHKQIFGNIRKRYRSNLLDDDEIFKYVQQLHPCMRCGETSPQYICTKCLPSTDWHEVFTAEEQALQNISSTYEKALSVCRACMAIENNEEVICGNTSCVEYFPRKSSYFAQQAQHKRLAVLTSLQDDSFCLT